MALFCTTSLDVLVNNAGEHRARNDRHHRFGSIRDLALMRPSDLRAALPGRSVVLARGVAEAGGRWLANGGNRTWLGRLSRWRGLSL